MEEAPFKDFNITDDSFLYDIVARSPCLKCRKSRMHFCYECYCETESTKDKLPRVKLPVKVDIIKHPSEVNGKSTSGHGALLAPDDCRVFTYPNIPNYEDTSKMVLVFPGKDSITFNEYIEMFSKEENGLEDVTKDDNTNGESDELNENGKRVHIDGIEYNQKKTRTCHIERVVFIDSTWHQVHRISSDERISNLRRIELKSRNTFFWRHQTGKPSTYLATIEAVYYFMVDYHVAFLSTDYSGEYDDLLFVFSYTYARIRKLYKGGKKLKAYKPLGEEENRKGGGDGDSKEGMIETGSGCGNAPNGEEKTNEKVEQIQNDKITNKAN